MHELSIAQSILDTVIREVESHKLPQVKKIVVRVGALSGVMPDALQFSFEAIIPDTALAASTLEIEQLDVQGKCQQCEKQFDVENFSFTCPDCHSTKIEVVRGYELDIAYVEVGD
ncbi:hydrogenase maturation nickel metallochaperone HypA [candidate division KSB1 bacterium RBG_16_48_16]|nr:MAG: hydrogenase maturation nickel metallochaperone HypA [candidate division KSB1 bacterium RBG_16_48_16]